MAWLSPYPPEWGPYLLACLTKRVAFFWCPGPGLALLPYPWNLGLTQRAVAPWLKQAEDHALPALKLVHSSLATTYLHSETQARPPGRSQSPPGQKAHPTPLPQMEFQNKDYLYLWLP